MVMIDRKEASGLLELIDFFPAVGIVGPRQVGKTTLAKHFAKQISKPNIYIDLELPSQYEMLISNPEWFLAQHNEKTVIIDEVQLMLPLFPILRALIDQNRVSGRFILLGSASPEFLAKSNETLAGRIAFIELKPLNLEELEAKKITINSHWFRGGFPTALLAQNDKIWYTWQQNYIKSYVERDLALLGVKENPIVLFRILKMIANIHGSLLNILNISKSLQIDQRKVKLYLQILEHAFLLRTLQPWHVNISKRLVKSPKIYLRDSGNLHYLLDINEFDSLIQHNLVGNTWEGYAIEQICNLLNDSVSPFFYRTSNGAEIDLVLVKGIIPVVSIEIKLSLANALSKGNYEAIKDLNTTHNFLITHDGGNYMYKPQWKLCNLKEVLVELRILNLLK